MNTIFVLGGGGFLARHIEKHWCERGCRVISIGRAAASSGNAAAHHSWSLPHPDLAGLLSAEKPDLVVNAAGGASVRGSLSDPLGDFQNSVALTFRVLDDLRQNAPRAIFIQLSSAAVYGNPAALPVREEDPIAPISPYGWHRRMSELALEEYATVHGVRCASLRIFSAYGPGLARQVIWEVARKICAANGARIELQGFPDDSRDFIHATDIAAAVEVAARAGALRGEVYNVAAGSEIKIGKLVQLIARTAVGRCAIEFDEVRRPGNPSRWHADIGKLRALGFRPRVRLEDGVADVVRAVQDMYV